MLLVKNLWLCLLVFFFFFYARESGMFIFLSQGCVTCLTGMFVLINQRWPCSRKDVYIFVQLWSKEVRVVYTLESLMFVFRFKLTGKGCFTDSQECSCLGVRKLYIWQSMFARMFVLYSSGCYAWESKVVIWGIKLLKLKSRKFSALESGCYVYFFFFFLFEVFMFEKSGCLYFEVR